MQKLQCRVKAIKILLLYNLQTVPLKNCQSTNLYHGSIHCKKKKKKKEHGSSYKEMKLTQRLIIKYSTN